MSSVRAIQVDPLPQSSGESQSQKEMEKTNTTLSMLVAQSSADRSFDPPAPPPMTSPTIREAFCSGRNDPAQGVLVVAILFILYGILSK
jgi:hypothetical protein